MNKSGVIVLIMILLTVTGCGGGAAVSQPKAAVAPLNISGALDKIDVCQAIPKEDIEAVMGRKLVSAPERFEYYDTPGTSGCSYDAGKESSGEAHFGYVVLTPAEVYGDQPLYKNVAVKGIGQEAYFNNGADARQLWIKVSDKLAFVVAFGDSPNEEGAQAIAKLVAAAIVSK
jgi:hypothetical protein